MLWGLWEVVFERVLFVLGGPSIEIEELEARLRRSRCGR